MTRSEAYAEGWHVGRRWAEEDIRDGAGRYVYKPTRWAYDISRASDLGFCRGYRDTWARWDAGTLTWEMLEHAPVGK